MKPLHALAVGLIGLGLVLPLQGCEPPVSPLEQATANAGTAGRLATTDALEAAFLEGEITFQACLESAEEQIEAGDPSATVFAGAVLDLGARIEDRLPKGGEYELFWWRLGQLASRATYQAMQAGRFDEAETLVLAGPKRWQRLRYWQQYPNHDIMVALSMAHRGESREGIARLRSRAIQTPEMEEAILQIRELDRQRLRERLREQIEAEQSGGS